MCASVYFKMNTFAITMYRKCIHFKIYTLYQFGEKYILQINALLVAFAFWKRFECIRPDLPFPLIIGSTP